MTKYSKKAQEKIGEVMHEFKEGKLKSASGKKVKDRDQAVAIAISEAREKGLKTPAKPKKKPAPKKSAKKK